MHFPLSQKQSVFYRKTRIKEEILPGSKPQGTGSFCDEAPSCHEFGGTGWILPI